jgi:uncharacterized membrane protein YbaN (DUF454 family)
MIATIIAAITAIAVEWILWEGVSEIAKWIIIAMIVAMVLFILWKIAKTPVNVKNATA